MGGYQRSKGHVTRKFLFLSLQQYGNIEKDVRVNSSQEKRFELPVNLLKQKENFLQHKYTHYCQHFSSEYLRVVTSAGPYLNYVVNT